MEFVLYVGCNRVGKSTMTRALLELVHRGCKRRATTVSFGDGLREELVQCYGLPREMVFNTSINKDLTMITMCDYPYDRSIVPLWIKYKFVKTELGFDRMTISLRNLMINHGNKIRRVENPHHMTELFQAKIDTLSDTHDLFICDDARHPIDFEYFRDKKVHIYHLTNGLETPSDHAQDLFLKWLGDNEDLVTTIPVTVPLLKYTAEKLNITHVIPTILPKKVVKSRW